MVKLSVHEDGTDLPKFPDSYSPVSISESFSIGNTVMTVSASGTNTKYEIVSGNENDIFDIAAGGRVTVKKKVDHETKQSHNLIIRATVPSIPEKYSEKMFTVNVVDVNDNAPVFIVENSTAVQTVYVDRFSPDGTIIAKVQNLNKFLMYLSGSFFMFVGVNIILHSIVIQKLLEKFQREE